jgi:spore germination cell wall hydrolase CwlJ-like protein
MNSITRAAGFAAAFLLAVAGTAYGASSQTWDSAPITSSLVDHESASLQSGDLGLNPADGAGVAAQPAVDLQPAPAPIPEPSPAETGQDARRPLAELVGDYASAETGGSEHECLAGAVYFEAKGEPLQGQLSVAEVVLNRSHSGRFPASLCGVVKQRGQFSFVRGGHFPAIARGSAAWHKAVAIARIAMADMADGPAPRALFFHATRVSPGWHGLTRLATIGNHVFYR